VMIYCTATLKKQNHLSSNSTRAGAAPGSNPFIFIPRHAIYNNHIITL
jgi:hypothetical protein